jgi:hypothetical protein
MEEEGFYTVRHRVATKLHSKTIPKIIVRAGRFSNSLPDIFSVQVISDRITAFEEFDFKDAEGRKSRALELDSAVEQMFEQHAECCGWKRKVTR